MSLKRSDKMIALAGVLILIIAGIGIVLYVPNDDEGAPAPTDENGMITFQIEKRVTVVEEPSENIQLKLPSALSLLNKGKIYQNAEFKTIDEYNVESVTFNFSFQDKQTGFGLIPFILKLLNRPTGTDTVTIEITDPSGVAHTESLSHNSQKSIPIKLAFDSAPEYMEAESIDDVEAEIIRNYTSDMWFGESFKIVAQLNIKGKTNPIARLLERFVADTVNVQYSYTYYDLLPYEYDEENGDEYGDGDGGGDNGDMPSTGDRFSHMSYGGRI